LARLPLRRCRSTAPLKLSKRCQRHLQREGSPSMQIDGPVEAAGAGATRPTVRARSPSMQIDGPVEARSSSQCQFDDVGALRRCRSTAPLKPLTRRVCRRRRQDLSVDADRRPR